MNHENNNIDIDHLKRTAINDLALLVDSLEEVNFRQGRFLRALHAPSSDSNRVSQYASDLRDLYNDCSDLLKIYLNETNK